MFAPLSEHIENRLDEAFCNEYRVYGTYDKPSEWEEYKEDFAKYIVEGFDKQNPKRPKSPWGDDL
jgi:hypothetical protein